MTTFQYPIPVEQQPIFILGILPRCGTNYLFDLLHLHPDTGRVPLIWEDYFLYHSDALVQYIHAVSGHWNPPNGVGPELTDRLARTIGSSILAFLAAADPGKRVVTKTPRVDNLPYFVRIFPDAPLLILVRDGRAVVESGVRTFGWHREWAIRQWKRAADTILSFDRRLRSGRTRYLILRYEDLCTRLEPEMGRVLKFLNLDVQSFDFDRARQLPVRGSSTYGRHGRRRVHWHPMEKTSAFNALSRASDWPRRWHERFNWVAGRELSALGYEPRVFDSPKLPWYVWNVAIDLMWQAAALAGPLLRPVRQWRRKRIRRRFHAGRTGV